jgi:hypothetical protein
MFFDVDTAIVDALMTAFAGTDVRENIYPAIFFDDVNSPPVRMPAIRVVFLGMSREDELDMGGIQDTAVLKYGVVYYFRSFREKDSENIYPFLHKIFDALKRLETKRGVLKPSGCQLVAGKGYYAYMCEFALDTII